MNNYSTASASGRRLPLSRRNLLVASGAGSLAAVLASCTGGGQSGSGNGGNGSNGGGSGTVEWWDQFRPLTEMFERDLFDPYVAENPGITIERTQLEPPDLGQALQAARRSGQMPDVHSLAGLDTAAAALVSENWFLPISDFVDVSESPVEEQLFDGFQRFGDDVYSVPIFSGRWHENTPWFNTVLMEEAGVDPEEDPLTWDGLREVARQVADNTDAHAIFVPGQEPGYLNALVNRLAQSAGAPGGIDWHTGEYLHDSQPFLDAMEFLRSLHQDGLIHPASPSMGPRDARARWAAGEGAIYLWGAWFIGGLLVDEAEAVERGISCWSIPRPETERNHIYSAPAGSPFWLSSESDEPQAAAELILRMTMPDFQVALAEAMDQPPALLEAVGEADVHPAWAKAVANFEEDVRIAPAPEAGSPGAWRVLAQMRDIRPHPGDIAQSMLAGEDVDVEASLRTYREAMTVERDRAIESVQSDGYDVDVDAWVFSNWDPESDYEIEDYEAR